MKHCILRRWLTGITLMMMVVAMAGYASHHHGDPASHAHSAAHCDLCVAFSATAGVPVPADVVQLQAVVIGELLSMPAGVDDVVVFTRAHAPRAPPPRI